ncbi:DUF2059 domain-containing protein [Enterovibrio makurazakiensis]|uniref:DUF2059 domain-containing protein n=1 Tax=Enterovibrio makurazakiensis TaxID=2910232 RepID=UPI003D19F201
MRNLKNWLAVVILLFSTSVWANSHEKTANELLDVMEINKILSESINATLELQMKSQPKMKPFEGTMRAFFSEYMSGESLRDSFTELYMNTYTEEEMKELIAFFKTPTGKKSIQMTAQLTAKGAEIGQKRVMENAHVLQRMIKEEAERIKLTQNQ